MQTFCHCFQWSKLEFADGIGHAWHIHPSESLHHFMGIYADMTLSIFDYLLLSMIIYY